MKIKDFFDAVTYRETGVKHIEKGKGCEDNVYTSFSEETGVKVVALSDGAGSYKNAAIGSEITSRVAAEFVANKFDLLYDLDDESAATCVINEVLYPLNDFVEKNGEDLLSYSATLLCAAMHPDGRYIVLHVGDGAIVGYNKKNGCEIVSIYEHDGPANQATFVTVENTKYNFIKGRNDYISFVLMSDGPEDFLVNEIEVNARVKMMIQLSYFISEDSMKEQLASLIQLLNNNGMNDDASFAIINDIRESAFMFTSLTPELRSTLFDIESDLGGKRTKKTVEILNIVSGFPNGTTAKQLSQQLHVHSEKIAKKKIQFMVEMKLIEYVNGRYFIAK